jgi:uncharacterized protein
LCNRKATVQHQALAVPETRAAGQASSGDRPLNSDKVFHHPRRFEFRFRLIVDQGKSDMSGVSNRVRLLQLLPVLAAFTLPQVVADDLRVLFMGDNGHHRPVERFHELQPAMSRFGIDLTYTDDMSALNSDTLSRFDGLMLYANIDRIDDAEAKAVLEFVAGGRGFIPLHCATYCWRNSPEMVSLMGAQFQRHGGRIFTTQSGETDHPIMKGYDSFTSWDETYIHHRHNDVNRTILEYRAEGNQAEGNTREPWTWIRTYEAGRIFYTAWGHDQRTFTNPGFQNLVARGTLWACGRDPAAIAPYHDRDTFRAPAMTARRTDVAPFEFVDVGPKIPNYTPGARWGAQGEDRSRMQSPLPASESIKHFSTPVGLAVRLYADESHFQAKPIAMTWDERGRLWVCETVDYPNELGGNRDRIRICEDTNGDAVADKFTVFAHGLSIPTAIVVVRGGAVVQNGKETIYLKDTTGDDVADVKTTLITGWTLGDTHGGVSNFRYGLDNWIWSMQGYNNSTPEFDGQKSQSFRMGFWRFRLSQTDPPVVTDLEFVRSTNNNTWGLGISEEGLVFGSTANHNPSVFMPIPNRYFERVRGWAPSDIGTIADTFLFQPVTKNIRQVDQFGGYTAGAGHALYTARAFPERWWNRTAFVCGPTGHLVGTFVLRASGSGYRSTSPVNLLASDDEWCGPIMAEVGPDGAVWVIDWYNYIVQHNPTPRGFQTGKGNAYESDLRDRRHGRIYRVVPSSQSRDSLHAFSDLGAMTNSQLVQALRHPSMMWRLQAQRLLVERHATDVVTDLLEILDDDTVDKTGLNAGVIQALNTLDGLGVIRDDQVILAAVAASLNHASAGVRRNALSVLPDDQAGLGVLLKHAAVTGGPRLLKDDDQQVRLMAVLRYADMPTDEMAGRLIVDVAADVLDSIMAEAVTAAAAAHAIPFLKSACQTYSQTADDSEPTAQMLKMVGVVSEHIARGRPTLPQLTELLTGLQSSNGELTDAVLAGLLAGWPQDHRITSDDAFDALLPRLVKRLSTPSQGKLLQLATLCNSNSISAYASEVAAAMLKNANEVTASTQDRILAVQQAISFQPDSEEVLDAVLQHLTPQTQPELAAGIIEAVGTSRSPAAAARLAAMANGMTPTTKSAVIRVLLSRPATTDVLLDSLRDRTIDIGDLTLDQKQALQTHPDEQIRRRALRLLASSGDLPNPDREKVLQSLMKLCQQTGDQEKGKEMFVKHCSRCHLHGTKGKNIGPNLTGMAVHPKPDLLTHIIDPSRSVEGNFRIYTVVDTDGLIRNGMMTSESRTSITLVDTEAKEHVVPREDIERLISSRKSVMPDGFEKQMSAEEMASLLEFLTTKGKFLPIALDRYATAISTKGLFSDGDDGPDRMVLPDWSPRTSHGVPFVLTDPRGKSVPNIILFYGPRGTMPPKMPRQVTLPCNSAATAVHFLSGVGGWNWPAVQRKSVSMTVRLNYVDGVSEDHRLLNGVHFADYIRRVDVPDSQLAFMLGGQQMRQFRITPARGEVITTIDLVKGNDPTAPIVMAVTVERPPAADRR